MTFYVESLNVGAELTGENLSENNREVSIEDKLSFGCGFLVLLFLGIMGALSRGGQAGFWWTLFMIAAIIITGAQDSDGDGGPFPSP